MEIDEAAGRARLAAAMPAAVRAICAELAAAGEQAVAVGGSVRDALLGRTAPDWDVATSATPEQVVKLFRRTIPTGITHGTVTVLWGKASLPVEVTTFRGEGAYTDGRRPDQVRFGVPLTEDLARRDFVVNAIAFDPACNQFIDPFDGIGDLRRGILRAVGDPQLRFSEDGLRIMRAVRFAATLELAIDPETEGAIPAALPALAKVSAERICVELSKLLGARQPSRGLVVAERTGIVGLILSELSPALAPQRLRRVDAGAVDVRLAALLAELDGATAEQALRRLKFSNDERDGVVRLLPAKDGPAEAGVVAVRRMLAAVGKNPRRLVSLWQARLAEPPDPSLAERLGNAATHAERVLAEQDPLHISQLAIRGNDLTEVVGIPPGPQIGRVLHALLAEVWADPTANHREELLRRAHAFAASLR